VVAVVALVVLAVACCGAYGRATDPPEPPDPSECGGHQEVSDTGVAEQAIDEARRGSRRSVGDTALMSIQTTHLQTG